MKLWPARTNATKLPDGPVTDLDAIIAEPVPFRFRGKIHILEPIQLMDFLRFANAHAELQNSMQSKDKLSVEVLADKMLAVFQSVCKTITLEDLMKMEQVQVAALYQLVLDMVSGQVDMTGEGKKKRQKINLYDSVQPLSSPSAPPPSDGPQKPH